MPAQKNRQPPSEAEIQHAETLVASTVAFLKANEAKRLAASQRNLTPLRPYRRLSPSQLAASYRADNAKPPRRG